ncbi:MAG: PadR family transcriptional regulator [Desulfobacula sp.]|uniref:PadR family transcriptional regulator n=1 Tax=Desulfobacula sp. TaxID=2593537 RepID=UPI0025BEE2A8|nr:PadR family transcriptional regulator [Desulfobacula sp.]MCD4719216.1 PadR family transcriptional regulator [Desulfobacula sp.]
MKEKKLDRDIFGGLIKLHILYHASKEKVFGLWIIEELRRHGYEMSPGTLYPTLHRLEKRGYLKSEKQNIKGKIRRLYSITPLGGKILSQAKSKVRELFGELFDGPDRENI